MQVIHCGFKMVKFSPAGQIKRRQKHVNSTKNSGICEMRLECRHLLDEQDDCCMSYNGRRMYDICSIVSCLRSAMI